MPTPFPRPARTIALALVGALLAGACGGDAPGTAPDDAAAPAALDPGDWDAVLAAADGQVVDWWLYGGDARVNAYLDEHVVPAAAELGVTLRRVPIDDTAEAVQRVDAEVRAGEADGAVDLIWINGENFAAGREAGLWLAGWADDLPNTVHLDPDDPTLVTDFGLPTDGMESPWSRAALVYASDPDRSGSPPADVAGLLAWARENPGRFTYPAPPDFTGSAFVRQVVEALGEDEAFRALAELHPLLWREGAAQPVDAAELHELFGNGEVDVAMSYNPAFVAGEVASGRFADTVRPFVLADGTLSNVSFVTIPANAGDAAGAMVVADLLLDPRLQAIKADPDVLGVPTVLAELDAPTSSPYLLDDLGTFLAERSPAEVDRLEARWQAEVP